MADQFTSIATTPGLADELSQDALDLAVRFALREMPTARMFVDSRPGNPNMHGATITLEKIEDFSDAVIAAATSPLTEEADVDSVKMPKPTPVQLTPNEYGFAVTRTKKFNLRAFTPPDPLIARAVAYHQSRVMDKLVQTTFQTGTQVRYANLHTAATTTATSADTIAADNLYNAKDHRRAVNSLRRQNVQPWAGGLYVSLTHPDVVLDLREETGADKWLAPQVYGVDQSKIWAGTVGVYEGVQFVQNNLVDYTANTGSIDVYQNYMFGRGAVVEWVLDEPHTVIGPVTDKLGRFRTVGWVGDLGWVVYENKALIRTLSTSAVANE